MTSLWPHGLQHTRPRCASLSPEVNPSLCPSHRWCHPAISSSDALFFCTQSFQTSETFPMRHLLASHDQNTEVSTSASVLPTSIQGWFPLRLTGLISLQSKGLSGVFSNTTVQRHQFFSTLPFLQSSSHNHPTDISVGKESACNAGDPGLISGLGRSTGEGIGYPPQFSWASLVAQLVKNLPAMWETWVWSLGWEDLLEKGTATHSSILARRIP